jgi:hypothetical protein
MKRLLSCLIILISALQTNASHLMGGEITWQCLPTGEYKFFMKLYRDCNGVSFSPVGVSLDVSNKPGLTSIPMTIISQPTYRQNVTQIQELQSHVQALPEPQPELLRNFISIKPNHFKWCTPSGRLDI